MSRGAVRRDGNGKYLYVVDVAQDGEKRKQRMKRGFATRKAAQDALDEVNAQLRTNAYVAPQRQTLATFLTDTWLPTIERTVRPSTFESYRRNMRLHVAGRPIGRRQLQQVDPTDLNRLYKQLLDGVDGHRALSARSVAYIAAILHRVFRDAVRWRLLVTNPAQGADKPSVPRTEMKTWSAEQLANFLNHVGTDRLAGAWWLLATTGMRRGEVLGLRWSDLDLDSATATIRRTLIVADVQRKGEPGMAWSTPKTRKGWRTVALDLETVAAIRAHRKRQIVENLAFGPDYDDQDLVVCREDGTPMHPKTVSYYFTREVKRAGLPIIRLQDLRHTHATLALRAGVHPKIVQERLGHANIGVTMDTYTHVAIDLQADAAAQVAALMNVHLTKRPEGA